MSITTKTRYETDFVEWAAKTVELLRQGRYGEVDMDNVAEEIEALRLSQQRAVRSQLKRILMHLLKRKIQPERAGAGWDTSIISAQGQILDDLEDAPSLRRHLQENLGKVYRQAIRDALRETRLTARAGELGIPERCPYTLDELLNLSPEELAPQ